MASVRKLGQGGGKRAAHFLQGRLPFPIYVEPEHDVSGPEQPLCESATQETQPDDADPRCATHALLTLAGGGRGVPLRDASRSRCKKTPRGYAGSLRQGPQLRPNDIFRDPTHSGGGVETTIGSGQHTAWVADGLRDPLYAVGDDLRMLHEVRLRIDHAGHDQLIAGERCGL